MPKKIDKYDNERKELLIKLFNILGINENNNTILLHDLDTNEKLQNEILSLEPDIKKYFFCGKWSCFSDPNIKRKYLSFIKYLMKDMDYYMMSQRKFFKLENGNTYRDTIYHIIKKNP